MHSFSQIITAAMLVIGDELLSGRTRDCNIGYLAGELTKTGIELMEVRIVPDRRQAIIQAVNALRKQYDYVFTSGGIGPTHDDMTTESVAEALGLPCIFDAQAETVLADYYTTRNLPFTETRRLMARMPQGARHIENPVSAAPGFYIDNIFVMAGVPQIFQAMVQNTIPYLKKGTPFQSCNIPCPLGESVISEALEQIQRQYPQTLIGSYPHFDKDTGNGLPGFSLEIVVRSRDAEILQQVRKAVENMISARQKDV